MHPFLGKPSKISLTIVDKIIPSISDEDQHYLGTKIYSHGKESEVLGDIPHFKEAENLGVAMNTNWQSMQDI